MNLPKTLLQIAGAAPVTPSWHDAALLLIDHQREYLDGGLALPGAAAAVEEMKILLAQARAAGAPVIHIVHHGRPGGALFDPQSAQAAIIAGLQPLAGETHIVKSLPNAFAQTALHSLLLHQGRKQLVLAGFATHMCISATARSALDHGYQAVVVANACATRDLPAPGGGVVSATALHSAALAALADRFAAVVRSAQDIAGAAGPAGSMQ